MQKYNILVSVIIPIYKVENYLAECVDSVLAQTYKNIEIILVDDGSPDKCPAICDEYANKDGRIKVIHKQNGGLSDARNVGLAAASGEYIFFIDSDDYWNDVAAVEKLMCIVHNKPEIDFIYFDCIYQTETNKYLKDNYESAKINGRTKTEILEYLITIDKFVVSACFKLIKRSVLIDNQILFKKGLLSEDYDWCLHLFVHSKVIYAVDANFYSYRMRNDSISKSVSSKHLFDIWSIISDWYNKLPNMVSDMNERELYLDFLGYMYGMLMSLLYKSNDNNSRKKLIQQMKPYSSLLNRTRSNKMKKVNKLYRIVGFDLTWRILGIYNKRKVQNDI